MIGYIKEQRYFLKCLTFYFDKIHGDTMNFSTTYGENDLDLKQQQNVSTHCDQK